MEKSFLIRVLITFHFPIQSTHSLSRTKPLSSVCILLTRWSEIKLPGETGRGRGRAEGGQWTMICSSNGKPGHHNVAARGGGETLSQLTRSPLNSVEINYNKNCSLMTSAQHRSSPPASLGEIFLFRIWEILGRKLYKKNFIIIWYLYRYGRALSVLDFISLWFAKMKRSNLNIQIEIFQIFPNHNGLAVDTNSPMGNIWYWTQWNLK